MSRPIPLRPDQPPDDTIVVIRGGVLAVPAVRRAAQRTFDTHRILSEFTLARLTAAFDDPIPNPAAHR